MMKAVTHQKLNALMLTAALLIFVVGVGSALVRGHQVTREHEQVLSSVTAINARPTAESWHFTRDVAGSRELAVRSSNPSPRSAPGFSTFDLAAFCEGATERLAAACKHAGAYQLK